MTKFKLKVFAIIIAFLMLFIALDLKSQNDEVNEKLIHFKKETEIVNLKKTIPSTELFYKVDTEKKVITFVNSKGEVINKKYQTLIVQDSNEDEIKLKINYLIEYNKKQGEVSRLVKKVTIYEKQK